MKTKKNARPANRSRRRDPGPRNQLHREGYGLGWCAREAHEIATWMAKRLPEALPPGEESLELVRRVAEVCPYILSEPQLNALLFGFEGRYPRIGGSIRMMVCRSAGRQLAALKGGL